MLIIILCFLLFNKLFLFWLWLWQLKEYHWGRFRAHFETQALKKIISSLWRVRAPKLTVKTLAIIFYTLLFEFVVFIRFSYLVLLLLIIFAPVITSLIVFLFQGPTIALRNRALKKAEKKREKFKNLIVVGITGSYGKTSTKEFLAAILAQRFHPVKSAKAGPLEPQFNRVNVLKTAKNINSEIGIAQTILRELNSTHQVFIAEIGAYNKGKIKEVCAMLKPKIGILTGINEQHMSTFGSQENIIKAKFELIESLPEDGTAILNGNNKIISNLKSKIENLHLKSKIFCSDGKEKEFWTENLLMAKAAAKALGMGDEEINKACQKIKSPVQIKKGINGAKIIDCTYSANPNGVIAHLEYLKTLPGRKIIVMPCLIELGKAAKQVHQRIGKRIARICDLAIITTKDYFAEIKQAAIGQGMAEENILFIEKPRQILEKIKTFSKKDDIILLGGRLPKKLWKLKK